MAEIQSAFFSLMANRYVSAAVIVLLSLIAAAIVDFIVGHVCRALARRTATTLDDRFIDLSHQPIHSSVIMLGLWLAAVRLELPDQAVKIIGEVLGTIVVVVWTVFTVRFVGVSLSHLSGSAGVRIVQPHTRPLFDNLSRILLVALAIYFVFLLWDINVTGWLASAGIIGIAVGFAAKDTLANLFSGIFILTDAPYKVGDYINLDSGERGEVTHIGLRSTRLLTRDDVEITIPNAVMANAKIVNEAGGPSPKSRIRIPVGVAYGSDADRVREILVEIGRKHEDTSDDPEPRARFRAFGAHSLDFELLCWIDEPVLRGRVLDELNGEIYKRLGEEGIEIPFPKRDVYIKEMPK